MIKTFNILLIDCYCYVYVKLAIVIGRVRVQTQNLSVCLSVCLSTQNHLTSSRQERAQSNEIQNSHFGRQTSYTSSQQKTNKKQHSNNNSPRCFTPDIKIESNKTSVGSTVKLDISVCKSDKGAIASSKLAKLKNCDELILDNKNNLMEGGEWENTSEAKCLYINNLYN